MITLDPVMPRDTDFYHLYQLLQERTAQQSISHTEMPTLIEHKAFCLSQPYWRWYIIGHVAEDLKYTPVGSIYLQKIDYPHQSVREVGIAILKAHQRKGYARSAVNIVRVMHPGPMVANVNPENGPSIRFWMALGFQLKQVTYATE